MSAFDEFCKCLGGYAVRAADVLIGRDFREEATEFRLLPEHLHVRTVGGKWCTWRWPQVAERWVRIYFKPEGEVTGLLVAMVGATRITYRPETPKYIKRIEVFSPREATIWLE